MRIKIKALTPSNVEALGELAPERVAKMGKTFAVLNGESVTELRDNVQTTMDTVREISGTRNATYRSLIAVRNKLDGAIKAPKGVSAYVEIVPNGIALDGAEAPTLDGVTVEPTGTNEPEQPKSKGRTSKPKPETVAAPETVAKPVKAPAMPYPRTDSGLSNLRYLADHADTPSARDYWTRKLADIRASYAPVH